MFQAMAKPLMSQAKRIAHNDPDLAQSIVAMAYKAYDNAQSRGKNLSVGELVNFMKYRATDLKNGKRLPFGNRSTQMFRDVYNPRNYLNGDVEVFSLDFMPDDKDRDYSDSIQTSRKDGSDNVVFQIGLQRFFKNMPQAKVLFQMREAGYSYKEIAQHLHKPVYKIKRQIKEFGREFIRYFELPESYVRRYGLN